GAVVEQAVGVSHLNFWRPLLAVKPPGVGAPDRTGVAGIARAPVLAVDEPEPSLAVDAELRVREADMPLILGGLDGFKGEVRLGVVEARQLGDGPGLLAVPAHANHLDGARVVQRIAALAAERAIVLAPFLRADFVSDPEVSLRVVG